jgi:E3 ubiquitin-protein ligase DOA10
MRYVHVECLDAWRRVGAAANRNAAFRCQACHYEYTVQRTWVASALQHRHCPTVLTAAGLLAVAFALGAAARSVWGDAATATVYRLALMQPSWRYGDRDRDRYAQHLDRYGGEFDRFVFWVTSWRAVAAAVDVSAAGVAALAAVGFVRYVYIEVHRRYVAYRLLGWRDSGWQGLVVLGAWWISNIDAGVQRIALIVGAGVSIRASWNRTRELAAEYAQSLGERVLEVRPEG